MHAKVERKLELKPRAMTALPEAGAGNHRGCRVVGSDVIARQADVLPTKWRLVWDDL